MLEVRDAILDMDHVINSGAVEIPPHPLKGRKQSPEHIRKRIACHIGRPKSDEQREKTSAALLGRPSTSTTKFKPGQQAHNRRDADYTFVSVSGYRHVRSPHAGKNGWRHEHTAMAEVALGRKLKPGEEVHHLSADKLDNRNSNFLVCSSAYHRMIERAMSFLYQREHFGGRSHEEALADLRDFYRASFQKTNKLRQRRPKGYRTGTL